MKSTEWEQYQTIYKEGAYDLFLYGWFPDYPDADDYLSPFLIDGGFFQNDYTNPEAEKLIAEEQGTDDQAAREEAFGKLQDIVAEDVPFIPCWVGHQHRGVRRGHGGRGGHARPGVHLPLLARQQVRLPTSTHVVVGRRAERPSPRSCAETMSHDVPVPAPCRGTFSSACCWSSR